MITKSAVPDLAAEFKDTMTREPFIRGEPIRRDKLVKAGIGGYMAAVLPSGMRAVAIHIENSGDTSAGGFILPNDRVDVVRIYRDEEATRAHGTEVIAHQTILANVRVLAIGQNVQEENGKKVVVGGNATLELDPKQAEMIVFAPALDRLHPESRASQSRGQRRRHGNRQRPVRRLVGAIADHRALRRGATSGPVRRRK